MQFKGTCTPAAGPGLGGWQLRALGTRVDPQLYRLTACLRQDRVVGVVVPDVGQLDACPGAGRGGLAGRGAVPGRGGVAGDRVRSVSGSGAGVAGGGWRGGLG
jgi:hypothetical protein